MHFAYSCPSSSSSSPPLFYGETDCKYEERVAQFRDRRLLIPDSQMGGNRRQKFQALEGFSLPCRREMVL